MPGPKAVLVDLFDTLVTTHLNDPKPHPGRALGIEDAFDAVWAEWGERRTTGPVPLEELISEAARRTASRLDRASVEAAVTAWLAWKRRMFASCEPSVLAMLDGFRRRGLRIAIVSGCATEDAEVWRLSPLAGLVDVTAFSCEIGVNKPDAAIYLSALDELDVIPADAAFVGDGAGTGAELVGAAKVGIGLVIWATWYLADAARKADSRGAFPAATTPRAVLDLIDGARSGRKLSM